MSVNLKRSFRKFKNKKRRNSKRGLGADGHFFSNLVKTSRNIFFVLIVAVTLYGVYRAVRIQVNELKQVRFQNNQKISFGEDVDIPGFSDETPFSLMLIVGEGIDKKIINHVVLIHLDPVAGSGFAISFPSELRFNSYTPNGYDISSYGEDFVKIEDMLLIGDLMNPPRPIAYSIFEIEEILALDVDAYIYFDNDVYSEISGFGNGSTILVDESVGSFSEQSVKLTNEWLDFLSSVSLFKVWANRDLIADINSNMIPSEVYSFVNTLSNIEEDRFHIIEFSEDLLVEEVDAKGDIIYVLNQNSIDNALKDISRDERIEKEQARVEIFNGSGVNGLGNRYGRWIRHLGADVIRVENASGDWPNTVIYVTDDNEYEYSLSRIKSIWNDDIEIRIGRPEFISTGDIIVVLGLDI